MKTNGTLTMAAMQLILLFGSTTLMAQPKYDFRNATKISGSNRQVGALYRFPNVRTGIDALVTITAITGGITLDVLDDNSSGFDEAFQPTITAPAHSKGYVEFSIQFVAAGTTIPQVQTEIPVTPIDVDGKNNTVFEFDEIYRYNASYIDYNMVGSELNITFPSANWVDGVNKTGIDYAGIDTTAKQVMFTVANYGTSILVVRTGADNRSGSSQQRLRSLYFQKFSYPSSVLSLSPLPASGINNATVAEEQLLKVFPSAIKNMVTVKIKAGKTGTAVVRMVDYSGRTIKQQSLAVQAGVNSIVINDLDNVIPGNYIILMNMDKVKTNQKVIKL
jgi:hypothetical protein